MSQGQIIARHYASREPVAVEWSNGVINRIEPVAGAPDVWIAPAIFDPQVNGYAGIDFQQDHLSLDQVLRAIHGLQRDGCARLLMTLVTNEWPRLLARLAHLNRLREESLELQHAIAGWHIEGPFISAEPGFHGAHNPAVMRNPDADSFKKLREIVSTTPLLVTLAPERAGSIEAIQYATTIGITVSLGHTDAPGATLENAVRAGATGFTHLANACPPKLDRHDNIIVRALDVSGLTVSVIPDGFHVPPPLFRVIHRSLPADSIIYTTDAMAAAGAPPGKYTIGAIELEVSTDQVVRQPGRPNFAGSALRPIQGVFRAAEMLRRPWQEIWDGFSTRVGKFMGVPTMLEAGSPADFCLIGQSEGWQQPSLRVFVQGKEVV